MVQRTRIDDEALKSIVSVPSCVWSSELTSLGRTQVSAPTASSFRSRLPDPIPSGS